MSKATISVDQVLKTPFPSYHQPLDLARALSRSGEEAKRLKAVALLEGLRKRYPHVLAIGQEFVLALIECNQQERAEQVLKALENTFANLDEESLCRWGRLFKNRGDDYLELPAGAASSRFAPDLERAEEFYRRSLKKYDQAYRIRGGHYPCINKATLLLVGSLMARRTGQTPGASLTTELIESVELAGTLLKNWTSWRTDQPDDERLWHPATAGEAHLLRQEWAQATALYCEAMEARTITHHARESMRRQVDRILLAFGSLGISIPSPFDDTAAYFAPPRSRPPPECDAVTDHPGSLSPAPSERAESMCGDGDGMD
jgi:hypothetical protein